MYNAFKFYFNEKVLDLLEKVLESPGKVLEFHIQLTVATLPCGLSLPSKYGSVFVNFANRPKTVQFV